MSLIKLALYGVGLVAFAVSVVLEKRQGRRPFSANLSERREAIRTHGPMRLAWWLVNLIMLLCFIGLFVVDYTGFN